MKSLVKAALSGMLLLILTFSLSLTAFAEKNFSKEDITWELFDQYWYDSAPGTENPECSFEYHIFSDWLNENYEKSKSESGVWRWYKMYDIQHAYSEYYEEYLKDWKLNDDGEFTIQDKETGETLYRFELIDGMWHMIDMSGNTVDIFEPHGGNGEWGKKVNNYGRSGHYSNRTDGNTQNEESETDDKIETRTNDAKIDDSSQLPAADKAESKASHKAAEGNDMKARVTGNPVNRADENISSTADMPDNSTQKKKSSGSSIILIIGFAAFVVIIVFFKKSKGGKK